MAAKAASGGIDLKKQGIIFGISVAIALYLVSKQIDLTTGELRDKGGPVTTFTEVAASSVLCVRSDDGS